MSRNIIARAKEIIRYGVRLRGRDRYRRFNGSKPNECKMLVKLYAISLKMYEAIYGVGCMEWGQPGGPTDPYCFA